MMFMMQLSSMHCIHRVVKLSSVFKVIDCKSAHEQRGLISNSTLAGGPAPAEQLPMKSMGMIAHHFV